MWLLVSECCDEETVQPIVNLKNRFRSGYHSTLSKGFLLTALTSHFVTDNKVFCHAESSVIMPLKL